jgi:hypothetical protein
MHFKAICRLYNKVSYWPVIVLHKNTLQPIRETHFKDIYRLNYKVSSWPVIFTKIYFAAKQRNSFQSFYRLKNKTHKHTNFTFMSTRIFAYFEVVLNASVMESVPPFILKFSSGLTETEKCSGYKLCINS